MRRSDSKLERLGWTIRRLDCCKADRAVRAPIDSQAAAIDYRRRRSLTAAADGAVVRWPRTRPNWLSYPHWHPDWLGVPWKKWHLPVVEPLVALWALLRDGLCP
jgi:hypothetical protein